MNMLRKSKVLDAFRSMASSLLALAMIAGTVHADETATLSIKSIPNVNIRMYGFIENDLINDSTEGLNEETDNPTIAKANAATYAGNHHETIMSIRNSRLGFDITMPKTEYGLETEGIFEFDFLGNQADQTTTGAAYTTQSQRDFFNNAAVRVRAGTLSASDQRSGGTQLSQCS